MIDLYGMSSPNVQKIFIALEELELEYRFHRIAVAAGQQFSAEFRALNPNSKVPVIVDHLADGTQTVFESGAILIYLADKTGRLLPHTTRERTEVLQWLMFQVSAIGPMTGQFVHFRRYATTSEPYSLSRYRTEMLRLWQVLDERFENRTYLAGDTYSIADIALFPWVRNRQFLEVPSERFPHLATWVARVDARPAVQRALARIDAILPTDMEAMQKASKRDLDRYFGRHEFAAP